MSLGDIPGGNAVETASGNRSYRFELLVHQSSKHDFYWNLHVGSARE